MYVGACVGVCVCVLCFTRLNVADEKHDERGTTDMICVPERHKHFTQVNCAKNSLSGSSPPCLYCV